MLHSDCTVSTCDFKRYLSVAHTPPFPTASYYSHGISDRRGKVFFCDIILRSCGMDYWISRYSEHRMFDTYIRISYMRDVQDRMVNIYTVQILKRFRSKESEIGIVDLFFFSYRMERAMQECNGFDITTQNTIRNGIINALNIHREAVKLVS